MGSICYYDVLGVGRSVTADELKAAYQQQALQLHPDRAGECSQDRFQLLQQAWQVLREPGSRAVYDHQLSQAELRATVTLHDEIDLEDMDVEGEGEQEEEHCSSQTQQQPQQQHTDYLQEQQQMQQGGQGQQEPATAAAAAGCVRSYPCRCGDSYVLRPVDMQLAAQQIILPCRSCSNAILVRLP